MLRWWHQGCWDSGALSRAPPCRSSPCRWVTGGSHGAGAEDAASQPDLQPREGVRTPWGCSPPLAPGSWQLSGWGEAARVPPEPRAMPQAITAPQLCPLRGCSPAPPGLGRCPNACELLVQWPWGSLLAVGLVAMGHGAPRSTSWAPCTPPLQCWHAPAPALPGEQGPGCLKGSTR